MEARDIIILVIVLVVGIALVMGRLDQETAAKIWLTIIGFYSGMKAGEYIGRAKAK